MFTPPSDRISTRNVNFMATCLCDSLFSDAAKNAVEVLRYFGAEVNFPSDQTCCGQPAFNSGDFESARKVLRKTIEVFSTNDDPIVVPSASCAAMLYHSSKIAFRDATSEEKELYVGRISEKEMTTLEYLSKTVLSGARPYEFEILKRLMKYEMIREDEIKDELQEKYGFIIDTESFMNSIDVLQGHFVSKEEEYKKYCHIDIVNNTGTNMLQRMTGFADRLLHLEFYKQVDDIIEVGLRRYKDKFAVGQTQDNPFVLYEKYSRRDVSLLMNCGKDLSSTMYGMKRIGDNVFIFVTYHKETSADKEKNYVDGKPDYADVFEDNMIFRWDSQIGRGIDSSYMEEVSTAPRKHLLVKKSDAETNFYYMGLFDIVNMEADKKKDNNGKERDITKVKVQMRHPVREDLLRYLQSNIAEKEDKIG